MTTIPFNDDDSSVMTNMVDNKFIQPQLAVKELTICLRFSPRTDKANTQVASTHYKLLCMMKSVISDMKIIDNTGKEIKLKKKILSFCE